MISKVAVQSNGLALEAQTEDFVSLPGSACVTGLTINSQTEDLCVADSSPSGGIYLVDCKDASFTKLRKNGSPSSLKTVNDVSLTSKGNLVFSDVEARRIGRFDSDAAILWGQELIHQKMVARKRLPNGDQASNCKNLGSTSKRALV